MPGLYSGRFHLTLYRIFIVGMLSGYCASAWTQNLAPNPGFEMYTMCPTQAGQPGFPNLEATPWYSVNGTADYYNVCAPFPVNVPYGFSGFQYTHSGLGMAGGYYCGDGFPVREYIRAPLLAPLEAGVCYKVGYWYIMSNQSCPINTAGVLLTNGPGGNPYGAHPQVDWSGTFFTDTMNWTFVFDYYQAVGGEDYITIGNFHIDAETDYIPGCKQQFVFNYGYADDVIVEVFPMEPISVDLGGPVEVCNQYLIDPGLSDEVFYTWSNGTHGSTLLVYTTGEYSLTVSYGCNTAEASVEVTVHNPPPVDLGPPSVVICPGDEYMIALDPDEGQYEWNDGSTNEDYSITEAGLYYVTLDDGCDITSDSILVEVLDPPLPFNLGPDTFFCEDGEIVFQFDPSLGDFEWQDNDDASTYHVEHEGSYALTISNMCGEQSDDVEIIEIIPPSFTLGPDEVTLCPGEIIDLDFDPEMGSFLWQDGNTNSFYQITSGGLYSLTVTNECGIETQSILVDAVSEPHIDLGLQIDACLGDTITLYSPGNTGDFLWQDGSTDTLLEVTGSGTYSVTITNACAEAHDVVLINFHPAVSPPELGPDVGLCPGQSVIFDAFTPGSTYLWSDLSTADTLLVNTAGTYFVHVNNFCGTFTDTVHVAVNTGPPPLQLPADLSLCQGQAILLDAVTIGVTYHWNDNSTQQQLLVSSPGSYALTITNSCGTAIDSILVSDGGLPPFVSLGADTSICPGNAIILTPAFTNVDVWTWQDGSSNQNYTATTSGTFSVQADNFCGTAYDTILIGLLPATPPLSLGLDTALCPGTSLTLSIAIPDVDIIWFDGTTDPNYTVIDSASIFASISNSCGVSRDTVVVTLLPDIPALDLGQDQTICPGELITIDPGIPNVIYTWQDGSTNTLFQTAQEQLIVLTISNSCGSSIDSLQITESLNGPQLNLGPDVLACEGETIIIPSGISGVNYLWQDGSNGSSFTATTSGPVILEVSNACGVDRDTVDVDIHGVAPVVDLGRDTTLCDGKTVLLSAAPGAMNTYTWQDGSTQSTFLVSSAGIYYLKQSNQCGDGLDSVIVGYRSPPSVFELGPDTTLCPGESILLASPVTTDAILWQDGSSQPTLLANEAKTYSLQVSNECGIASDHMALSFDERVPVVELGPAISWCEGDEITLNAMQTFQADYAWSNGASTPVIVISLPGLYSVDVSVPCSEISGEVEIFPGNNCNLGDDLNVPNIFSPNGDNINDVFALFTGADVQLLSLEGMIFDRWGNLVFSSTDIPFEWNGNFKNEPMNPGVYVYVIKVHYQLGADEVERRFIGDVTLIR